MMRGLHLCPSLFLRESPIDSRYYQVSMVIIILYNWHKDRNSYNNKHLFSLYTCGLQPGTAQVSTPCVSPLRSGPEFLLTVMVEGPGSQPHGIGIFQVSAHIGSTSVPLVKRKVQGCKGKRFGRQVRGVILDHTPIYQDHAAVSEHGDSRAAVYPRHIPFILQVIPTTSLSCPYLLAPLVTVGSITYLK